jgi:hypothetical protein
MGPGQKFFLPIFGPKTNSFGYPGGALPQRWKIQFFKGDLGFYIFFEGW